MEDCDLAVYRTIAENQDSNYQNVTIKTIYERASCRVFSDKEIPAKVLDQILEAGARAPSAGNFQPYSIIKVQSNQTKQELSKLCGNQIWISKAPIDLLFCLDWHRVERMAKLHHAPFTATNSFRHFWASLHDTIICAQNICIAAESLGLGSVYIGNTFECFRELRSIFELPKGVLPVILLCMGYPKTKPRQKKKLGINIIVHDEKYRKPEDKDLIDAFRKKYSGLRFEITDEKLNKFFKVCSEVHGEQYVSECVEIIKKNGYINALQRDFGLFYFANLLPKGNPKFVKRIEESGFNVFKEFM